MVMNREPSLSHSDWEEKMGNYQLLLSVLPTEAHPGPGLVRMGDKGTQLCPTSYSYQFLIFSCQVSTLRDCSVVIIFWDIRDQTWTVQRNPSTKESWGSSHMGKAPPNGSSHYAWMLVWNARIVRPYLCRALDEPHRNSTLTIFSL